MINTLKLLKIWTIMPMYNLIEYSDNYADSSGSLYQFKRDKSPINDAGNRLNVTLDNSASFKYRASLLGKATDAAGNDISLKNAKIVVPLKYLSNFFRPLEMLTLSTKDNENLIKGFKRSVYWNEYKSKIETKTADDHNVIRFPLDASFQGVNRLFVLAFDNTENGDKKVERDSHGKYFLPRVDVTNYNVLIHGRNFYDQPISDRIKKYHEIKKIASGKGDNYATGCLLDYQYFRDHYQLICCNLSQLNELDADEKSNQQIEFYGKLETNSQVCTVFEKSKETILKFYKGTAKML